MMPYRGCPTYGTMRRTVTLELSKYQTQVFISG